VSKVFISYRRDDSAAEAGRLCDRLVPKYGADNVFKDVDSIPLGIDFREVLGEAVGRCQVLLAIIGRQWLSIATPSGGRRLDDPRDFVRVEIEAALQRDIPVIPVLVSGAAMPGEDQLPSSLQALVFRNGLPVRNDPDFHRDVDRILKRLDEILQAPTPPPPPPPPVKTLAEQLAELMTHVAQIHEQAKELAEKQQDYAGAARLIEELPEGHRQAKLYADLCRRRDRVAELEKAVGEAVRRLRLDGLRPLVEEWLKLQPRRGAELQPLLDSLQKEPEVPPPENRKPDDVLNLRAENRKPNDYDLDLLLKKRKAGDVLNVRVSLPDPEHRPGEIIILRWKPVSQ
jgi:hypothetical protein